MDRLRPLFNPLCCCSLLCLSQSALMTPFTSISQPLSQFSREQPHSRRHLASSFPFWRYPSSSPPQTKTRPSDLKAHRRNHLHRCLVWSSCHHSLLSACSIYFLAPSACFRIASSGSPYPNRFCLYWPACLSESNLGNLSCWVARWIPLLLV
jgi:hypothetical protein